MKKKKLLEENQRLESLIHDLKNEKFELKEKIKKEKIDNAINILSSLGHLEVQHYIDRNIQGCPDIITGQKFTFTLRM